MVDHSQQLMVILAATNCGEPSSDIPKHVSYMSLVGGLEHFFCSHSVGNVIIPTDELIFFRGVAKSHQPVSSWKQILEHTGTQFQKYPVCFPMVVKNPNQ